MKTIFNEITRTGNNYGSTALRLILGTVLLAHGCRSLLGWFDGPGYSNMMAYLVNVMKLPSFVALSVIALQFFGSILLIIGLTTRVMALSILGMFTGMIVSAHLDHGFFMNWFGTKSGEGFEYHILVIGMCIALIILGGGSVSLDRALFNRNATK